MSTVSLTTLINGTGPGQGSGQIQAIGDPTTPLTPAEQYAVTLVLANSLEPGEALARANITEKPEDFFARANVQLFSKRCLAQWEMQMRLSVSLVVQNFLDMAEVDVVNLGTKKPEEWTQAERNAVTEFSQETRTDPETGESVTTLKVKTNKFGANKELTKILGLKPEHPAIRSMGAFVSGAEQDKTEEEKKPNIMKIAGQEVKF